MFGFKNYFIFSNKIILNFQRHKTTQWSEMMFQCFVFRGKVFRTMKDIYININKVAEAKGLKRTRSIRMAINNGKYQARKISVNGGFSYEILYSSLEIEIQEKLEDEEIKSTALVPMNNQRPTFVSESAKMTSLERADIVVALNNIQKRYKTKKEAESIFLDLYNSGMLLPAIYKYIGSISIGTLHRWVKAYEDNGAKALIPQRKCSTLTE